MRVRWMQAVAQRLATSLKVHFGGVNEVQITARHLHGTCASTLGRVKRTLCACLGFLDARDHLRWRRYATAGEVVVLDDGKSGWSTRYSLSETPRPRRPEHTLGPDRRGRRAFLLGPETLEELVADQRNMLWCRLRC